MLRKYSAECLCMFLFTLLRCRQATQTSQVRQRPKGEVVLFSFRVLRSCSWLLFPKAIHILELFKIVSMNYKHCLDSELKMMQRQNIYVQS